jgi:outer membrane protein TolC
MTRRWLLALALSGVGAGPVLAQSPAVPPVPLPPRVGVAAAPARPITLDEVIRLTVEQNNDVAVAMLEREAARQDVRAIQGFFDPRVRPNFSYQSTTSPVTSIIGGGADGSVEQTQWSSGAEVLGRTPWGGGRWTFDFAATRLDTTNTFQRLNPQFPTTLGISLVQPLARNRGLDPDRRQLLVNRIAVDLTDAQLTRLLMDQLSLVEQAYWDLVFASRNVELLVTALTQARRQVESNERQVLQGTLAPIDVVEAETQLSTFEQRLATAQQALTVAENRLKTLMLTDRASELWNRALVPMEARDRDTDTLPVETAVELALRNRPELAEYTATVARNDIDRRFFAEQVRPQVDLVARYGLAGLAGTIVERPDDNLGSATIPDFFGGGLGTSLGTIGAWRFPVLSVQLQMDWPFRNRTATANLARAAIEGRQLERTRDAIEQGIEAEVRNALQAVVSSQARLAAATSAARNAELQYESEQRRFESGLGTVFLVLQRQTALVTAQAEALRARADRNQALAVLYRALGTTLDEHGVSLESAGPPP